MDNATLRKMIRQKRKNLTQKQRQHSAFLASLQFIKLAKLLPKGAKIGLYLGAFGELPTAVILKFCQKYGHMPYLPITCVDKPLVFVPIFCEIHKTPLKRHAFGMKEPLPKNSVRANRLDCIICPLVAVNGQGFRLGMGGGFYDRTFEEFKGLKVGYGYEFQAHQDFDVMAWDRRLDYLVTERQFYRFGSSFLLPKKMLQYTR